MANKLRVIKSRLQFKTVCK